MKIGTIGASVRSAMRAMPALVLAVLAHRDSADPDAEADVAQAGSGLESLRRIPRLAQVLLDRPVLMRFDSVVGGESIAEGGAVLDYFRDRMRHIRHALCGMLNDGIHRVFAARSIGAPISVVAAHNVSHPYYALALRDGWAGVDIWTLPGDKFGCSGACWRAGVGSWIAFDDGRSYSNAVLEVMGAPRR